MQEQNPKVTAAKAREALRAGRLWEAEELSRGVLAKDPNFPTAQVVMGMVAAQTGRVDLAILLLEKAVPKLPEDWEAANILSNHLRQMGRMQESEAVLAQFLARTPNNPELNGSMGLTMMGMDRPEDALVFIDRAIQYAPNGPVFHHNRGLVKERQGDFREAIECYQKAIQLAPRTPNSLISLGNLLAFLNQFNHAIECYDRAYELEPNSARGNIQKAHALLEEDRCEEAAEFLKKAVSIDPRSGEGLGILATTLAQLGRFDEASDIFYKAIRVMPHLGPAYSGLAMGKKFTEEDRPFIDQMKELLQTPLARESREHVNYAIAKALNDLKEYGEAMGYYDEGNAFAYERLVRAGRGLDREKFTNYFEDVMRTFTPDFFAKNRSIGSETQVPIFVVGMIRSGTTLTEQIVCSHPEVGAAGEARYWVEKSNAGGLRVPWIPDESGAREAEKDYLAVLEKAAPGFGRITDKMPLNFMGLGPIHTVFPNAKIIHCRRNPVDNCLSIYMTQYRSSPEYGHNRENTVWFYGLYERLMAHWRAVLPADRFLEVQYEDLVSEPEENTRRIIDFLELEWDDACLRHDQNERAVRTPSLWQARQPIYKTSKEKWRNYEPWLGAFADLLKTEGSGKVAEA